jgi:predicted DCC family thiol-disulfide oxidoreductase YuxK
MIPTVMARDPTWTILYDADCGVCRWLLGQILSLDRRQVLRPVALGTPEADHLLAELTPEQRMASWHLIDPSGRRSSAGIALAPLVTALGGGEAPAALLSRAPGPLEFGYRLVASNRSRISRLIPQPAKRRADAVIAARARSDTHRERAA